MAKNGTSQALVPNMDNDSKILHKQCLLLLFKKLSLSNQQKCVFTTQVVPFRALLVTYLWWSELGSLCVNDNDLLLCIKTSLLIVFLIFSKWNLWKWYPFVWYYNWFLYHYLIRIKNYTCMCTRNDHIFLIYNFCSNIQFVVWSHMQWPTT